MAPSRYVILYLAMRVSKVTLVTCARTGAGLASNKRFAREDAAFLATYPA